MTTERVTPIAELILLVREQERARSQKQKSERALVSDADAAQIEYDALRLQLTASEKDAARYRWLRMCDWSSSRLAVVRDPKESVRLGRDCPSQHRLDDYIDTEMAK